MDNFVDYVKICVRSGKGGSGSTHLRREKCVPKGGPDGGDGGRGGNIILKGNKQLWTLLHLKYRKHVIAKDGENGSGALCSGKEGGDEYLDVPLGTIVKDVETGAFLCEISNEGQEYIIAKGGRGGLGNFHFRTPTFQTPRYSQPGEPGVNEWKVLELKVLADVGLVGFPNAGKSTLLSVFSAAKPEIANYPFTTLTPQLGIVKYYDYKSFIMADIPGIIEGASEGKGLGLRFLRHIERNSTLLFLVNADSKDIFEEYKILLNELKKYNPELLDKKRILGISKSDLVDKELEEMISKDLNKRMRGKNRIPYLFFSAHAKKNLQELKDLIWEQIKN